MIDNYELYHHGVKGMRWGVRRKAIKLTKMSRNADRYETKSKAWENRANALEKNLKPMAPWLMDGTIIRSSKCERMLNNLRGIRSLEESELMLI